MATNDELATKPPEDEPGWSKVVAPGGSQPPHTGSTVSHAGGTVAHTVGTMGMPTEFGRYRVRKQLGGGGMGAVYLVENTELKREEALKVPHFGGGGDPEVRERFLREARAAAQLDHANLCPVYDVGTINGVCFLTMRYLKGKLLSDFTGKPQPARKAVEITAKLAQALESAHAKGVIHRDLKPNNIMMCAGVGPVVMDFGLAKQTKSEDQKLTQAGTTMGTPSYMPPEQVKGQLDQIGPASDVYSLGVILFEMLTGRLPFKASTVGEVYGLVLHTEAPAPSSLRPGLDPALDAICAKALAKTPEGRFPSMKAFAAALIDFLKSAPAAEGAGSLSPTKTGPTEIYQMATEAPNQGATTPPRPRGEPTQRGNKAPSSIVKRAGTQRANPQVTVRRPQEKKGQLLIGKLGLPALILLLLGALGVIGFLVYTMSQKKAGPAPDVVIAANLITPSETGQTLAAPKVDLPTAAFSKQDAHITEPTAAGSSKEDAPITKPAAADPPTFKPSKVAPMPPARLSQPPAVSRITEQPEPIRPMAPPTKGDPPKIGPFKRPKAAPLKLEEPEEPEGTVLLEEDFAEVEVGGGRPKGWEGDSFGVQMDKDRHCLQVTKPSHKLFYVQLPKVGIKGDFAIDCEFRLCGRTAFSSPVLAGANTGDHEFHLELASRDGAMLKVGVDHMANVQLDAGQVKNTEGFKEYEPMQFRLTRKGDLYNVSINGQVTIGRTLPRKGVFQTVRIGLTGGKPVNVIGGGPFGGPFLACLYSVKITSLEPPGAKPDESVTTPAPPSIEEDFTKTAVGRLPEGWPVGQTTNIAVRKTGDLTALELVNPKLGTDQVTLPNVELKGDFNAAVTAVMVDRGTAVEVLFTGGKGGILAVKLDYGGAVTAASLPKMDGSKFWKEGKPNVLRIERSGKDKNYVIKLNDSEVGSAPLAATPGPFTQVKLAIFAVKDAKQLSPQITWVQVVPLEEAP